MDAGTRYEQSGTEGSANLFGRIAPSKAVLDKLSALGIDLQSYTTRERQAFFCDCLAKDVGTVLDALREIALSPSFDAKSMEAAREETLRQIEEKETRPRQLVFDYLHATAFQGTPLAAPVLGFEAQVEAITIDKVKQYYDDTYKAPRAVIAAVGDVDHRAVAEHASKHWASMSVAYPNQIPLIGETRYTGSELRHRDDAHPLCHTATAVQMPPIHAEDTIAMQVGAKILGAWDRTMLGANNRTSKLAEFCYDPPDPYMLHRDEGCHAYEHFVINYRDTGLWGAYATMNQWQPLYFSRTLQSAWVRLCNHVTEAEVEAGKNALRTELLARSLTDTARRADDLARHINYYERPLSADEANTLIDRVTLNSFKNAFMTYLYDQEPVVATFGRVEAQPEYLNIRSQMWQWRT